MKKEKELIDLAVSGPEPAVLQKQITPLPSPRYYVLAQSPASNTLAHELTHRITDATQLDLYGNGKVETKDFRLFIRDYSQLTGGINTSAAKLLDSLLITATKHGLGDTLVQLPLKEYMRMRGLKDIKETRKQVKRDIDALERVRFEYRGRGKERGTWLNVTLAGGTSGIKNSIIFFRFNEDFYQSLRISSRFLFMFFPEEALRLNDNANPYSYAFARRISEHKRMNVGLPGADTIRVKTLIDACAIFPRYEDVADGAGAVSRRMIEPFERDLNALGKSFTWTYVGAPPTNYQSFVDASIHIRWHDYPSTHQLEASRAKKLPPPEEKKQAKRGGSRQEKGG